MVYDVQIFALIVACIGSFTECERALPTPADIQRNKLTLNYLAPHLISEADGLVLCRGPLSVPSLKHWGTREYQGAQRAWIHEMEIAASPKRKSERKKKRRKVIGRPISVD